jgi:ADP-ribosylglycohydrolase
MEFRGAVDVTTLDRFRGTMLGLAVGDALGAPVEFCELQTIYGFTGGAGVTGPMPEAGTKQINYTDDTQMAMATAEALLDYHATGAEDLERWLVARYQQWAKVVTGDRAPGIATMGALHAGEPQESRGAGGVMRVAPIGLALSSRACYQAAVLAAGITHKDPYSDMASGFLARVIHELVKGKEIEEAIKCGIFDTFEFGPAMPETVDFLNYIEKVVAIANDSRETDSAPYRGIQRLVTVSGAEDLMGVKGIGWVADEALGVALFCALRFKDEGRVTDTIRIPGAYEQAVLAAVNITGDSDTTGAVTGAVMGAMVGIKGIPWDWEYAIENREKLYELSDELFHAAGGLNK